MADADDQGSFLLPGARVGPYVLETPCDLEWQPTCLATGHGRTVALYFAPLAADHQALFEREMTLVLRLLAAARHPSIRLALAVGVRADFGWIALEPVAGESLDVYRRTRRPWKEVRAIMRQVGGAVLAAQETGLLVDFGPDEIDVDPAGGVRVDLASGPAYQLASGLHWHSRALPYQAPEFHRAERPTERSRQFVFCAIYWRALFGTAPFEGNSMLEVIHAVLEGRRRPPPPERADVPAALVRALDRGLATDPAARWPSMRELLAAIDRAGTWRSWLDR